jgi:predicted aspartyl protease
MREAGMAGRSLVRVDFRQLEQGDVLPVFVVDLSGAT